LTIDQNGNFCPIYLCFRLTAAAAEAGVAGTAAATAAAAAATVAAGTATAAGNDANGIPSYKPEEIFCLGTVVGLRLDKPHFSKN